MVAGGPTAWSLRLATDRTGRPETPRHAGDARRDTRASRAQSAAAGSLVSVGRNRGLARDLPTANTRSREQRRKTLLNPINFQTESFAPHLGNNVYRLVRPHCDAQRRQRL